VVAFIALLLMPNRAEVERRLAVTAERAADS
jgi:hypothetical protein